MSRKEQIYATDAMRRALQDSITALNLVLADSPSRQHSVQALKSCDKALKLIDKVPTDTIYLKTGEAARHLGISRRSVQLACEQGQLPCSLTPNGGHRRIKQEDLIAFKETFVIAPSVRIVWDINERKDMEPGIISQENNHSWTAWKLCRPSLARERMQSKSEILALSESAENLRK